MQGILLRTHDNISFREYMTANGAQMKREQLNLDANYNWHHFQRRASSLAIALIVTLAGNLGLFAACSYAHASNSETAVDRKLAELNKEIERNPKDAQAYFKRAQVYYFEREEQENALSDLNKAVQLNPQMVEALLLRAEVGSYLHHFDQADADAAMAIKLQPKWAGVYAQRAAVAVIKEDYNKAIADCQKALKIDPKDFQAHGEIAAAYGRLGRHKEAIQYISKQIEMHNKPHPYPWDLESRAMAKFHDRDFDGAIKDLNDARRFSPHLGTALIIRSYAEAAKGQVAKAKADAAQGLIEETMPSRGHHLVADLYRYLGNYERAIEEYGKSISINSHANRSYRNRGVSFYRLGQLKNALQDFDENVKLNPTSTALSYRALIEEELGRTADADRDIAAAFRAPSPTTMAYSNRGAIMFKRKKYCEALSDAQKALAMDKYNADAYQLIGNIYKAQKKSKEATQNFQKAKLYGYPGSVPQIGW